MGADIVPVRPTSGVGRIENVICHRQKPVRIEQRVTNRRNRLEPDAATTVVVRCEMVAIKMLRARASPRCPHKDVTDHGIRDPRPSRLDLSVVQKPVEHEPIWPIAIDRRPEGLVEHRAHEPVRVNPIRHLRPGETSRAFRKLNHLTQKPSSLELRNRVTVDHSPEAVPGRHKRLAQSQLRGHAPPTGRAEPQNIHG